MYRKPFQTSPEYKKIVLCIILQRFPLVKNDILQFFDDFHHPTGATKIIKKLKFEKKSGVYLSRTQIWRRFRIWSQVQHTISKSTGFRPKVAPKRQKIPIFTHNFSGLFRQLSGLVFSDSTLKIGSRWTVTDMSAPRIWVVGTLRTRWEKVRHKSNIKLRKESPPGVEGPPEGVT